jgi:uncharacterized metal-binding protein YceD (DUF177 family)
MTDAEFSRPVRLDTLGEGERTITLAAEPAERAALARRFTLAALDRLEAEVRMRRDGTTIHLRGTLRAAVTQTCVASGEPLPVTLAEDFNLRFEPTNTEGTDGEEIGLSEADCDTVFYAGSAIDVGEAVAETLLLALDPFPRHPDADAILRAAGVLSEEDAGPFAALKALRDQRPQ